MTPSSTPSPPPNRPAPRAPRNAEAGIGRQDGLLVAALTAAVVFGIGIVLVPHHETEAPSSQPAPPVPASIPPPPPPQAPIVADGAAAARTDDGAASTDAAGREAQTDRLENREAATRSDVADDDARPAPTPRKPAEVDQEERPADKDLAREAWRRNRPDVSTDGNKASLLIPIKGSIAGAAFRVTSRPHAVIVTLPKAASLITMRLYRVNRDGFRLLWIDQAEKDADPKDGTSLKIGIGDLGDPLVEIKGDFVRVTAHRTTPGTTPPAKAPAPERPPATKVAPAADHPPAATPEPASGPKPPAHDAD